MAESALVGAANWSSKGVSPVYTSSSNGLDSSFCVPVPTLDCLILATLVDCSSGMEHWWVRGVRKMVVLNLNSYCGISQLRLSGVFPS